MSNPLLELFISEAQELLGTAVTSLLKLEKQTDNAELINEAFRSVHTLKSSAAMFDFDAITLIAAAAEERSRTLKMMKTGSTKPITKHRRMPCGKMIGEKN